MWKPAGSMHVVDIDRDCFIVKFSNEQDYFQALTGGPWMILEHYLVVQQWDPSFRVSGKLPAKMVVWVRFPHLPILLYHPQILAALGNLIGRTVRVDLSTQNTDRGKFARLAVKIDLNEPLAPMIELDGAWRLLNMRISQPFVLSAALSRPPDGFGPWMMVERKHCRHRKEGGMEKESLAGRRVTGSQEHFGKEGVREGKNGRILRQLLCEILMVIFPLMSLL
ncbi:hypothetical protein LINPERHAP1_LOCUS27610 [Linum perenne]